MSDKINNASNDVSLLEVGYIAPPSSDELQAKILAATKTMPQQHAVFESTEKKLNVNSWFSWRAVPIALAVSLLLGLAIWIPTQQLDSDISPLASGSETQAVVVETNLSQASTDETPLSIEELEFFELLLIQDELILAQF